MQSIFKLLPSFNFIYGLVHEHVRRIDRRIKLNATFQDERVVLMSAPETKL